MTAELWSALFSSPFRPSLPQMWDCRYASASQFFVFVLFFCLLFPFGPRAIKYYRSTRTTTAVQTSNSLESEECSLFAVRSMHTLCRLHGPFSAEVYKYSTRKHLHVHFLFFLCFFFSCSEYAVLYAGVYGNIISPTRHCACHLTCTTRRVGS